MADRPKTEKTHGTDAPMCKLCKTRHWSQQGHNWPKKKTRRKKQ